MWHVKFSSEGVFTLLEGPSTVFWVAVTACTVVMRPSTIPKLSWITLAKGARQLVVQLALDTTWQKQTDGISLALTVSSSSQNKNHYSKRETHLLGWIVLLVVDSHNVHGSIGRGCRDDDFLGSILGVCRGLLRGSEHTGWLNNVFSASCKQATFFSLTFSTQNLDWYSS